MNGADFNKENDDELWNDIQAIFEDQSYSVVNDICEQFSLEFGTNIGSGFRFRYQSEIDKKSYSSIKGEKNLTPTIKVWSPSDVTLQLDLITEDSSSSNQNLHFNTLYEVTKLTKYSVIYNNGICCIELKKNIFHEIRLDFLGIRKWKLKEAIPRIKEMYPNISESDAKNFFNRNKQTVKLRALLIDQGFVPIMLMSNTIKSQMCKENNNIKIQLISPKIVADSHETLIIILEKKVTGESKTYLIYDKSPPYLLKSKYDDGQTFAFTLPEYSVQNPAIATIRIETSDSYDERPIRFLQPSSELRKRKTTHFDVDIPLKKPTNYDSPQVLYPESGNTDNTIEFDGPESMDTDNCDVPSNFSPPRNYVSGNDSCKDSGRYSDDKSTDIDSDDNDSYQDSDDESDEIEIEGNRRMLPGNGEILPPINFPPNIRKCNSRLESSRKDQVTNKIFSEVARIGHDFAFGKEPNDLFLRIEQQLPVVFTLQDDVGDTPLNNAILKGNSTQAERILKVVSTECKWALDLVNTSGHTALILAPACDIPNCLIRKMLDAGCRLDIWDDLGKSAVTYAIEYKNTEALSVLLEYIHKNNMHELVQRPDKVYYSPLQMAIMHNYADAVKMLLSLKDTYGNYMVDVNELALMNKDSALHIAVEREVDIHIIKMLLERPDLNINHQKENHTTALHSAIKMKLHEIEELLKKYRAEDLNDELDSETIQESPEEIDQDDNVALNVVPEVCSLVEVMAEDCVQDNVDMNSLTSEWEKMSIKGETRNEIIEILLNGEVSLNVQELSCIIRPAFQTMIQSYEDNAQNKKVIVETLARFNCLPNSYGILFDSLKKINRSDIIVKMLDHFSNGLHY